MEKWYIPSLWAIFSCHIILCHILVSSLSFQFDAIAIKVICHVQTKVWAGRFSLSQLKLLSWSCSFSWDGSISQTQNHLQWLCNEYLTFRNSTSPVFVRLCKLGEMLFPSYCGKILKLLLAECVHLTHLWHVYKSCHRWIYGKVLTHLAQQKSAIPCTAQHCLPMTQSG